FGSPLIVAGAAGLLGCIWQFFSEGRGTLAPVDPPKELVVRGLYRYVPNPMYVSVTFILIGETILFLSAGVLIETAIVVLAVYLFVVFYEEPRSGDNLVSHMKDTREQSAVGFHDFGRTKNLCVCAVRLRSGSARPKTSHARRA